MSYIPVFICQPELFLLWIAEKKVTEYLFNIINCSDRAGEDVIMYLYTTYTNTSIGIPNNYTVDNFKEVLRVRLRYGRFPHDC